MLGDVERKLLAILRVLRDADHPMGARAISEKLKEEGLQLTERAVRYHLKLMDERGWTALVGRRDGRVITELGIKELENARVRDKVGYVLTKIETLAFMTSFDLKKGTGMIPVNLTFVPERKLKDVLQAMKLAMKAGLCVSDRIKILWAGERIGEYRVPEGKTAVLTVCSIIINGALLKAGVPMDSKFGGILQLHRGKPLRFVELVHYSGSSLDPSEAFIRARMTSVREAAKTGSGNILANFREVPAVCKPIVEEVLEGLKRFGIGGVMALGKIGEDVCEVPVERGKIGMVLLGGLNPIACAHEVGIPTENKAMTTVIPYESMVPLEDCLSKIQN